MIDRWTIFHLNFLYKKTHVWKIKIKIKQIYFILLEKTYFFSFQKYFFFFLFFLEFLCFLFFLLRDFRRRFLFLIFRFTFLHFFAITNRPLFFSKTQFPQNSNVSTKITAADFAWSKACNSFGVVLFRSKSFILQAPDLRKSIHFLLFFIFLHCSFSLTWYNVHLPLRRRLVRFFSLYGNVLRTPDIRFCTCVKFAYVSCTKDI